MSWRVAAADMRAQEELLLACLLAVMVEERSLSGCMLGPWRAEIGMVEGNPFFASKKTQSFPKHSGIVEDDWSLGWKWEHYDRGQLFCTCTPGWRNWSFDRMKTIAKIPAPSYSPTSVNGCSAGSSNNEVILSPVLALHQQMLPDCQNSGKKEIRLRACLQVICMLHRLSCHLYSLAFHLPSLFFGISPSLYFSLLSCWSCL